ncbi:MAG: phosphoribosylformylglycinamidine synthase subunit PurL [Planctomycetota bacterium]
MNAPAIFRVDVQRRQPSVDQHLLHEAELLGLGHLRDIRRSTYFLISGAIDREQAERLGRELLADPVTEAATLTVPSADGRRVIEVQNKPGVMDPSEASVKKGAKDLGIAVQAVRVGHRITVADASDADCELLAWKSLANQAIEEVAIDPVEPIRFPQPGGDHVHGRQEVALRQLDDEQLMRLSQEGCLSLTLDEMRTIQAHFRELGREPTDVELESLAQTWSEHCVHKTMKGLVEFDGPEGTRTIDNLLKETIAKVTRELDAPWCISVFTDNSGIIDFDADYGVCLKVETHNHPSAIDPYGGANTGLGGVIRDILGTGLGARPIFNTDVFCFGPVDLPREELPAGCIHPRRLAHGVVAGVRDYGNRMGIPTVNGAVRFDQRYIGNPLVFCGTGGLIPREHCFGDARVGDHILVIGGRTGRDGIHGATFSSVELTEESESVSSGAVQIGNAIEEKKVMDTFLQARDRGFFTATTDCGAGGISSAIGEMGEKLGVEVHLERMPLKYEGLSYAEIWISEAQERMVAAVPEAQVEAALALFAAEDVEATDVGTITGDERLRLFYHGEQVADLDMDFLHNGLPRLARKAYFRPAPEPGAEFSAPADLGEALLMVLARPNVASKEWIIRQYDHEVQGGSIVKPLVGVEQDGPSDAAVVAPVLGRDRGVAVACGLNTCFGDVDAYHSAAAGIEEALRNLVCVGAPLGKVAILDNFCWGNCAKPENLGSLVRACEACYDYGIYYGTPFISGKDSLNNEFAVGGETIVIPPTLLITAMCVVEDVTRSVTMDVKAAEELVIVVGETRNELGGSEFLAAMGGSGGRVPRVDQAVSRPVLEAVAACTAAGLVTAAHDCSDGGLAVTLAEMAFAGGLGMEVDLEAVPRAADVSDPAALLFSESNSRIVITVPTSGRDRALALLAKVPHAVIGTVSMAPHLRLQGFGADLQLPIQACKQAWRDGLAVLAD